MSKNAQDVPETCPDLDELRKAAFALWLGSEVMHGLAALFTAILDASDEHSKAHDLAKIGQYHAADRCNVIDCERESLEAMLEEQS